MPRTPFIAQMEAAECGAACLAMLLAHYGHAASLAEVRESCGVSRDGTSAAALIRAAQSFGLVATAHRVELDDLAESLPAILHWEFNHFVVVVGVSKKGLKLFDPAIGPRRVSLASADEAFSGVRLSFRPGPGFRLERAATLNLGRYASVRRVVPALVCTAFAAFVLELIGILFPVASQVAIDFIVRPKQTRFILALGIVLFIASGLRLALALARTRIMAGVRMSLDTWLAQDFVRYMTRLPLLFFKQRSAGELASRVDGHAQIRDLVRTLSSTALDSLLVVTYSVMMVAYCPRLAATTIAVTLVRVSFVMIVQTLVRDAVATEVVATSREGAIVAEAFSASEAVKAFSMEHTALQRYSDALATRMNASGAREWTRRSISHLLPLLDGIGLGLIYWIGGRLVASDQLTLGVLSAFVAMSSLLGDPVASVVGAAAGLPKLKQVLRRLDDIWDTPLERQGGNVPGRIAGRIAVAGLSVRYGSLVVLNDVTIQVAAGERVAIVGPSGSGKSTLIQVISGLLAPSSGEVWIDEQPLSGLELDAYRAQIGIVLPDAMPLDASIAENITLGASDRSFAEVEAAAQEAHVHQEICALPDGYETVLQRTGVPLSGGQNQRVALARALLREPRVLLLDEATSSLNVELEEQILTRLSERPCTQILVTHRVSAMRHADRIIVMSRGAIVDQGRLAELAVRSDIVRGMLQAHGKVPL
jgi:ATP-binding cassette subfamily B protein